MREIKFRAWDKENKKYIYDDGSIFINLRGVVGEDGGCYGDFAFQPQDWVLEQYTGLKDKNGNEIYEGDIVFEPSWWWGPGAVSLAVDKDEMNGNIQWVAGDSCNLWEQDKIEIIGNIHDDKQLDTH